MKNWYNLMVYNDKKYVMGFEGKLSTILDVVNAFRCYLETTSFALFYDCDEEFYKVVETKDHDELLESIIEEAKELNLDLYVEVKEDASN